MPTPDSPPSPEQPDPPWKEIPEMRVQIPDHELLRRVGVGSYGEVWLARNRMGTLRAVKIVHRKKFKDSLPFDRELAGIRRFEPISRTHEGFIDILHIGINAAEEYFYYVMELGDDKIRGPEIDPATYAPKTLSTEIALHGHVSPAECLQWGIALSSALHQLHKHGLVHRDIKPSNIIFVSGIPKLADIGLVAELREARSFVGTEGFIPPEGPGKEQADVYSLGKVLYEAMTGRDRLEFPSLPKDFDQLPDKELFWEVNTVILQACQNEVADRYDTAWNMHTDLLLLTSGKSVKRLRELERLFARTKRIALTALPFVLVAGAGLFLAFREIRHRAELRQRDVGTDLANGNGLMTTGDLLGALPYFVHALDLEKNDAEQENNDRLRIGSILDQCPRLTHYWKEPAPLIACEFTPDGHSLSVSPAVNGPARLYDLASGKWMDFLPATNRPIVTFSLNGERAAVVEFPPRAALCDAYSLRPLVPIWRSTNVGSARFCPDSTRLIITFADTRVGIWNSETREMEHTFLGHTGRVRSATCSLDGKLVATASEDHTARIWDAKNERCLHVLPHGAFVYDAGFSPDNRRLVTACNDRKARVWDVTTGLQILRELEHDDVVHTAQFSPDNRLILTASYDGTVRLWLADSLRGLSPNPILRFPDRVAKAVFSPDSRRIAAVCNDGSIWVWDLAGAAIPVRTNRHYFSLDGSKCVINGTNQFRIIDRRSGRDTGGALSVDLEIKKAAFNCDASLVYTLATAVGRTNPPLLFQLHNTLTAEPIHDRALTLSNNIQDIAVNNDGSRCFTWAHNEGADLWDVVARTRSQPRFLEKHRVWRAFFAPKKRKLVVLAGNTAYICDSETATPLVRLVHERDVRWAVFNPDESRLLTCCQDDQLTKCYAQVWDVENGRAVGTPLPQGDGVLFGTFSLDGQKIMTAGEDFTAIVRDARTGQQLAPMMLHKHQVRKAAFAPDAKRVATASADATCRVWDSRTSAPLTPSLPQISGLTDCVFWDNNLITSDSQERSWIWNLRSETLSITNLFRLARLLTAGALAPSGLFPRFSAPSCDADWEFLKSNYQSRFVVSTDQVRAWHEYQALAAETSEQWFTAHFHLKRLIGLQGATPELIRRVDKAAAKAGLTDAPEGVAAE